MHHSHIVMLVSTPFNTARTHAADRMRFGAFNAVWRAKK